MARVKQTARRATGGNHAALLARAAARWARAAQTNVAAPRRRHWPGTFALRDIRKLQRSGEVLISKLLCQRLVRKIAQEYTNAPRFSASVVLAHQKASKAYLGGLFQESQPCAIHGTRVTVMSKDVQLARRIRGKRAYIIFLRLI